MEQLLEKKRKIISLLRIRGPSLPAHITKETNLDLLFSSALLSELVSEKTIKISHLKIGSSPLYFLAGQEPQLEKFSSYLPSKEREAFALLKRKKILEDKKQQPAIRVALRNIKDFAFPLAITRQEGQELFWRFYSLSEQEAREKLKPKLKPKIIKARLKTEKPVRKKARKEKSDFVKEIISLLIREHIEILEEKEQRKKEYQAVIRINSDIGKLPFLLVAKDKKRVTENDLSIATQKAQALKLPILFISAGQPSKKALAYLQEYAGLIKFKKYKRT